MRRLRTIREMEKGGWRGRRVLLRVDCNVAVDEDGRPVPGGEQRLQALVPTVEYLHGEGVRLVLLSHLGRPGGRVVDQLRLDGVAKRLGLLLRSPVRYVPDLRGPQAQDATADLRDGDMLLLENLRFDPGEESCDERFAADLARLGDVVVNDAFSVSHRRHASVALLPHLLPAYAGFLLAREVDVLQGVLDRPERPVVAVVGGAKLETKLGLLKNLLPRVDRLLTGGGIANTFLRASGISTGASLAAGELDEVRGLLERYGRAIVLPTDVRVARAGDTSRALVISIREIAATDDVCDLGPETVASYCDAMQQMRTCIWNGPLGKFELPAFADATRVVASCVPRGETFAVVGGGDTVRALTDMNLLDRFDHVSTGGGAMLALLEGAPMPGLEPLYAEG